VVLVPCFRLMSFGVETSLGGVLVLVIVKVKDAVEYVVSGCSSLAVS
jgi:hypothetical protein